MYTLFKKIKYKTHENVGAGRIHLPEMTFQFHAHTPGGVGYSRKLFGLHEQSVHGPWRLSRSPALAFALPAKYFASLGLPKLHVKLT